jgi:hypothetical protein
MAGIATAQNNVSDTRADEGVASVWAVFNIVIDVLDQHVPENTIPYEQGRGNIWSSSIAFLPSARRHAESSRAGHVNKCGVSMQCQMPASFRPTSIRHHYNIERNCTTLRLTCYTLFLPLVAAALSRSSEANGNGIVPITGSRLLRDQT